MIRRHLAVVLVLLVAAPLVSSCATPKGRSISEQRSAALSMRSEVMRDLENAHPGIGTRARRAAGYAVFSNVNVQFLLLGGGQGYGVAHDNATGRDTFMKMGQFGLGVGLGAKDFRAVFIFHDQISYRRFVAEGWEFGADADAALISSGDRGAQANAASRVGSAGAAAGSSATGAVGSQPASKTNAVGTGIEVFQLTESGVALKAMVTGTRYWKDGALN